MATPAAPVVERVEDRHRYEILVDGELAGFTEYLDRDEQRVFYHTEVGDAFAGQGLASRLVEQALTDVRRAGKRVVPVCPTWRRSCASTRSSPTSPTRSPRTSGTGSARP